MNQVNILNYEIDSEELADSNLVIFKATRANILSWGLPESCIEETKLAILDKKEWAVAITSNLENVMDKIEVARKATRNIREQNGYPLVTWH